MGRPKEKTPTNSKRVIEELLQDNHPDNTTPQTAIDEHAIPEAEGTEPAEIDPNSPEADQAVLTTLFKMASSGKSTTATIFWAKLRCGMSVKDRGKDRKISQAPTIVIRTEDKQA